MVTKHIKTKISTLIRYHIPFAIFVQRASTSKLLAWNLLQTPFTVDKNVFRIYSSEAEVNGDEAYWN